MINIRDISIKRKLVIMQVFTSIMVLGLCFAAFLITDIRGYKERKTNSMISLAKVIGSNSISAIEFLDNDAANDILSELKDVTPEVVNADILDKKGNIFAAYSKDTATVFKFHLPAEPEKDFEFIDNHLLVYNSILNKKNEVIGTVCMKVQLSELVAIKNQKYEIASVLLIVGLAVAFLIALINQSYISRRLLNLVNIMKQISKSGDYTRHVVVDGKDEITTLSVVFNNLMNQIVESNRKKDEFIGIASHELKTPLTSIKAYLQVVDEIENKQPNKQYIQKALDNVNKLQQLLFDLLDVSKIQSGQLRLDISEFDIDALLNNTIEAAQIVSAKHNIIREGEPLQAVITADSQRIEQVLINLLSNATKYSPAADKVVVYTDKTEAELIIGVRDFGIGIPEEEQLKVFERFYRTKDLSRPHISGFGLGLYICRDIIKRHNGRIWVESDANGTAFYFSLPLKSSLAIARPELAGF